VISIAAAAQTSGTANPGAAAPLPPSATAPAPTAPPQPAKVAVIHINQVIANTDEGKRELETLSKKFEPKRKELQALNKEVDDLTKQLSTQGDKLNDEERASRAATLEQKKKALQRNAEDAENDFGRQQNEVVGRILRKLGPIAIKYAQENGYTVLLDTSNPWPQSPLVWYGPSADITEEVIAVYNKQVGAGTPAATGAAAGTASKPTTGTGTGQTRPAPGTTSPPARPTAQQTKPQTNPPASTPR
jgi:outer membrane protein